MKKKLKALDIETLGRPEFCGYKIILPSFAIVDVPDEAAPINNWMYVKLPIKDQVLNGFRYDLETVKWWYQNKIDFPYAYKELIKCTEIKTAEIIHNGSVINGLSIGEVSDYVKDFISLPKNKEPRIYGNGSEFDCSLLQSLMFEMNVNAELWKYNQPQNLRTIKEKLSNKEKNELTSNAQKRLDNFVHYVNYHISEIELLQLHNPLYDAAAEACFLAEYFEQNKRESI